MTYAVVWDWRFNHIPLNRAAPFNYSMGQSELVDAVFTRKVGWGSHGGSSYGHGHGHGLKSDVSEHMHGNGYHKVPFLDILSETVFEVRRWFNGVINGEICFARWLAR
jgi:hypothetical protein